MGYRGYSGWGGELMGLWSKSLLAVCKKEEPEAPVIEWVTEIETQRGNVYVIDNANKTITIFKTLTTSGSPHHMNFEPIVMDGYVAIMPEGLALANGWWQCPNSYNNKGIRELAFDIVKENTTEVVATYTLLLDWDRTEA